MADLRITTPATLLGIVGAGAVGFKGVRSVLKSLKSNDEYYVGTQASGLRMEIDLHMP